MKTKKKWYVLSGSLVLGLALGDQVLHSIQLDTGDVLTVTKNTMFFHQSSDVKRTESGFDVLQEGLEVEAWSRQVNNHMFEAVEITVK
ncbi:hypothetical protein [Paenibacillus sp. An7]|uniref:hypothetical protein n=1 Tax=Paenibacillus sp. An7 TaxID=2689577 RepID=UPI0013587EB6|nr:hypothetical protein [Paenibacillus sp. An7]